VAALDGTGADVGAYVLRQTEVVAMVPEFGALAFLGDDHHLAPPGLRAGVA
jgi:hypothetical protein